MEPVTAAIALNNPKMVRAWCMYDWANSVYTLVITTAIFPIYYKSVTDSNGSDLVTLGGVTLKSSVLYSYALSLSFLIVALILPLLSGAADYTGNKKSFMKAFVWMGSLSCMGLYFFDGIDTLTLGLLCSIVASIGYSGSLVFYDAFLPEIVTEDRYDATSARGYSMGYYGSVILMIVCVLIIQNPYEFGFSGTKGEATLHATRATFVLVGLWWIGFSFIPFTFLPDNPYGRKPTGNMWTKGYREIRMVFESIRGQQNLRRYLTAFFFYNMGVQTVMYLATLFGTDVLHMEEGSLIATLVVIQIVAAFGAWLFSRISARKGNLFALFVMIGIWIFICIGAYFITNQFQFFAMAFVVGMIMGGIQALSRATYSKLIPRDTTDHASYFSFYDVTYNLSIVFGTFIFGFVNQITGDMRNSALSLAVFFIIGLFFLLGVQMKPARNNTIGS